MEMEFVEITSKEPIRMNTPQSFSFLQHLISLSLSFSLSLSLVFLYFVIQLFIFTVVLSTQ